MVTLKNVLTLNYILPPSNHTLKLPVLKEKYAQDELSKRVGGGVASGRGLTSESVAAVVVMMLDWPLGRSIIPTPSISSAGDHSSSSAVAKPARPALWTHTNTQKKQQHVTVSIFCTTSWPLSPASRQIIQLIAAPPTGWTPHSQVHLIITGYRVNHRTEFNLRKVWVNLRRWWKCWQVQRLSQHACGRRLSQAVIYYTRERTGQKELRLSIRKRSSVKEVWRKQLSVRATAYLHPTLESDPLPLNDSTDQIYLLKTGKIIFFCQLATRAEYGQTQLVS